MTTWPIFSFIYALLGIVLLCSCQKSEVVIDEFVNLQGNQIHVKYTNSKGDKGTLLFLHGGYLDMDMWNPQVKAVTDAGYNSIQYSDIGHGKTIAGDTISYGYEIIDQLISRYCSEGETVSLVGLSWGAMLAADYTLKYPHRVNKLMLASPGLSGWQYFQDTIAAENNRLRSIATEAEDTLSAIIFFHQNWVVGPRRKAIQLTGAFNLLGLEMIGKTMRNHWKADWSKLDTIPAISRLSQITTPTMIIVGSEDAKDISIIGDLYHKSIVNSQFHQIEGVAHLINLEAQEQFNKFLLAFLAQQG